MRRPEDFSLVLADISHADLIRDNHDAVTIANNSMFSAGGERRDINWQLPMERGRVIQAIEKQRQFILVSNQPSDLPFHASIILEDGPDPDVWRGVTLPENSVGLAKVAVHREHLGKGWAGSLLVAKAEELAVDRGKQLVFLDTVPITGELFWEKQNYQDAGIGAYYSGVFGAVSIVRRYVKDLASRAVQPPSAEI